MKLVERRSSLLLASNASSAALCAGRPRAPCSLRAPAWLTALLPVLSSALFQPVTTRRLPVCASSAKIKNARMAALLTAAKPVLANVAPAHDHELSSVCFC